MGLRNQLVGLGRSAAGFAADLLADFAKAEGESEAADEGSDRTPGGSRPDSGETMPAPTEKANQDPKSLFWDPFAIIEQLGYKERPSSISYRTLAAMVWKNPIIGAVIQTRINQVASFAQPQRNRFELGFRVRLREKEDKPTPADKKFIKQAETLLMRTGVTDNPRGRDNFERFLRRSVWDSLVYDQMAWEVVPNRKGQPAEWYAIDSASVRLADTARVHMNEDLDEEVRYVQIYDSMIVNEYTQEELCFGIRNPRTDMRSFGYGVSELEMLIQCVTALLHAWEYNQKFFSQGSAAKGLLNFKGAISEKQLQAFRRHWYQMLTGVQNAWRTPITNAEEIQWVSLQNSNRDMEYNAWMDFLIKVACGMYSMDPVEVNFKYGNTGQKSGMTEANNKEKITESKERGLRPLLRFLATCINQSILWPMNESFTFEFVGLDAKTQEEQAELDLKRVKSTTTVNELRAEEDKPPIDGGDIILDPVFAQFQQMKQQQEQMEQQQEAMEAQGGFPGGEEGGPPGGPPKKGGNAFASDPDFQKLLEDDEKDTQKEAKKPFGKSLSSQRHRVVVDLTL